MFISPFVASIIGMILGALVAYILVLRMQRKQVAENANEITRLLSSPSLAEIPVAQFRLTYEANRVAHKIYSSCIRTL